MFTSPLWFCVLAAARLVSQNLFLGSIVVSLMLWIGTIAVLKTMFGTASSLLWAILLFCASTGFYDYTSSGLENVLAYLVIALYLRAYLALHASRDNGTPGDIAQKKRITQMCISLGVLIVTRHDLILLLLPATIATIWERRQLSSAKQWAILCGIVVLPVLIYTLSSIVYYGFPFPNTAYAKLNTGISQKLLWEQGIKYFAFSILFDTITLLVIGSALTWTILRAPAHLKFLAAGVALNLAYVASVGGDFMQGRFLSYSYFVSVILWISQLEHVARPTWKALAGLALCGYLVLYPHTPFNSPTTHSNQLIRLGIADERGIYFPRLSLIQYLKRDTRIPYFPVTENAVLGRQLKASSERVTVDSDLGVLGYHAGIDKIIVDPLALSDPLLARMPVRGNWRIGHFPREIPDGYT